MTREERCQMAIEKGFKYNPETGVITNRFGKIINGKLKEYICLTLNFNNKNYVLRAHQFAWYWMNKETVDCLDHINGIKDDNRICNLRSVTQQENNWNRKTAKGYCWNKQMKKWYSSIVINYKTIFLGLYNNEEDARQAYITAKENHHVI